MMLQCRGEPLALGPALGCGSTAVVYQARAAGLDLAVKVLHQDVARSAGARQRLAAEARIVGALPPPHVPALVDARVDVPRPYIAMERIAGQTLRAQLHRDGPLSPEACALWVTRMCAALEAIHGAGYAHLDIKPAHIFVTRDNVRLVDFGSADDGSQPASIASSGTPSYISPERLRCGAASPVAADLWALGVVTFECLTGCRPFSGVTRALLLAQVLHGRIPAVGELVGGLAGSAVERVVARALCRTPSERFESCSAFADSFAAAVC